MATSSSHTRVYVDTEALMDLISALRAEGFNLGVEHYGLAHDLILSLIARGDLSNNPEELGRWLRPLLCNSRKEIEIFDQHFDLRVERILSKQEEEVEPEDTDSPVKDLVKSNRQFQRRWKVWVAFSLLSLAFITFYGLSREIPQQSLIVEEKPSFTDTTLTNQGEGSSIIIVDPIPRSPTRDTLSQFAGISTNGAYVAYLTSNGEVAIKNVRNIESLPPPLSPLEGNAFTSLLFSDTPNHLYIGTSTDSLKVWNIATGSIITRIKLPGTASRLALHPSDGMLAVGHLDGSLSRWSVSKDNRSITPYVIPGDIAPPDASGNTQPRLHLNSVTDIAFVGDSKDILSIDGYGINLLREDKTNPTLIEWGPNQGGINDIAFSHDGTRVISGGRDGSAYLKWLGDDRSVTLLGHTDYVAAVAFSPNDSMVATGSYDGSAIIWESVTSLQVHRIPHGNWVTKVAFSPNGEYLATGSDDQSVKITRMLDGAIVGQVNHNNIINDIAFSPDGSLIASASNDNTVKISNVPDGSEVRTVPHNTSVETIAYHPNGNLIATGSVDNSLNLIDVQDGNLTNIFNANDDIYSLAFSQSGDTLIVAADSLYLIKVDGVVLWSKKDVGSIASVAYSPTGKYVASTTESVNRADTVGTMIRHASTGEEVLFLPSSIQSNPAGAVFSPDGEYLAATTPENGIVVIHIEDALRLKRIQDKNYDRFLSLSPRGDVLLAMRDDSVWVDRQDTSYAIEATNHYQHGAINGAGRHLVVAANNAFQASDESSGDSLGFFTDHPFPLDQFVFNAEGDHIAFKDSAGAIQIYKTPGSRMRTAATWLFGSGWWLIPLMVLALGTGFRLAFFWRRQAQAFLLRKQTPDTPDLTGFELHDLEQTLFKAMPLFKLAQQFRRRRRVPSNRLHPSRTVLKTIREGGSFTPAFGDYQVTPEYLVLVDRTTFRDHQAHLAEDLIKHLREDGVYITLYFFDADPRICFPEDTMLPPRTLDNLITMYNEHRLLVFSEAGVFFSPISGEAQTWTDKFQAWDDRFLLTPEDPEHWGYRESILMDLFEVKHASSEGLTELAWEIREMKPSWLSDQKRPFPATISRRPMRWIARNTQPDDAVAAMLDETRSYLGEDGYYWLSACAVYPGIHWKLTLHLGKLLKGADGTMLLSSDLLSRLARLPWLRHGFMPDWLRLRLLSELEATQEQAIQDAFNLMMIKRSQGGFDEADIKIALERPEGLRAIARQLILRERKKQPRGSAWEDHVFLDFMIGRNAPLAMRVPKALETLINGEANQKARSRAIHLLATLLAFLIALVLSIIVGFGLWEKIPPTPLPVEYQTTVPPE